MDTIVSAFEKSTITAANNTINLAGMGAAMFMTGMILVVMKIIF